MKLKTTLRNLSALDVNWVSIVDRGANRLPFRIIKRHQPDQENPMGIDLSKLGSRMRKSETPAKAALTGVILATSSPERLEAVQAVLKAEGLDFTLAKTFDDGTGLVAVDEHVTDTGTAIRVSEDLALVVKGFEPYSMEMGKLSFGQAAEARGFYSGLDGAMGVLRDMVYDRMYKADSPAKAAAELGSVMNDFVSYVTALAKGLPEQVFKIEQGLRDSLVKADAVKKTEPVVEPSKTEPEAKTESVVTTQTTEPEAVTKSEPEAKTPDATEELRTTLLGAMDVLKGLKDSVASLGEAVKKIDDKQTATEAAVAEALKKSETATRAVQGTVAAAAAGADPVPGQQQTQGDDDASGAVIDTAYTRKRDQPIIFRRR